MTKSRAARIAAFCVALITSTAWNANALAQSPDAAQNYADAVRLLEQTSFGPTPASIAHVLQIGTRAYLDEQYAAPSSTYPSLKYVPAGQQATFCAADPDPQCGRDYYSLFLLQNAFFTNALYKPDQLRQRVAFALSQILVTSGLTVNIAYAMAAYQQIFLDNAFGNYEQILTRVTLSPVMGEYLNMVNNDKPSVTHQPQRELRARAHAAVFDRRMAAQHGRNAQARRERAADSDLRAGRDRGLRARVHGMDLPAAARRHRTHAQSEELSRRHGGRRQPTTTRARSFCSTARCCRQAATIQSDLATAIHNIFTHPNVGPFICRQLIQKLVTGDPSPTYVARVATVFNNNGAGVRGDLRAVVQCDPERSGSAWVRQDPGGIRQAARARALHRRSGARRSRCRPTACISPSNPVSSASRCSTRPRCSTTTRRPTRFPIRRKSLPNSRSRIRAPRSIDTTSPTRSRSVPSRRSQRCPARSAPYRTGARLLSLAADPSALLDSLSATMMHGTMSPEMRAAIVPAINAVPASNPQSRAKTAFYLVVTSPEYQVER